ncbi:MAG: metabolite traffic protein EboE [Opitutales bacterium]
MILSREPRIDLTYCLNVHPGQNWAAQREAIERCSVRIKREISPDKPFGLGLRIANLASEELQSESLRREAGEFFGRHGCYPFTINGFPYDHFHGSAVKEKVYLPDWQSEKRRLYTCRLAAQLAEWLPEGMTGSISTLPGSYKSWINRESEVAAMVSNLIETVLVLEEIRERTGREIHLGLEPEPDCYLETTEETVRFFEDQLFPEGVQAIQARMKISSANAEAIVRRHLGVCFDTCHLALQFEDLAVSWRRFEEAGIRISKVQISNALEVPAIPEAWGTLETFVEPVYLHQVKAKCKSGGVTGWPDLPAALLSLPKAAEKLECLRVHFHVPLFFEGGDELGTTAHCLSPEFFRLLRGGSCPHLEIETYTYHVLPDAIRPPTLEESVVKEYRWVLEKLGCDPGSVADGGEPNG